MKRTFAAGLVFGLGLAVTPAMAASLAHISAGNFKSSSTSCSACRSVLGGGSSTGGSSQSGGSNTFTHIVSTTAAPTTSGTNTPTTTGTQTATRPTVLPTNSGGHTGTLYPSKPGLASAVEACNRHIGNLPRITPSQIGGIGYDSRVRLVPVCSVLNGSLTQSQRHQIEGLGNVGGMLRPISTNRVLVSALAQYRYRPDDVLGMKIGRTSATVYVRRR